MRPYREIRKCKHSSRKGTFILLNFRFIMLKEALLTWNKLKLIQNTNNKLEIEDDFDGRTFEISCLSAMTLVLEPLWLILSIF